MEQPINTNELDVSLLTTDEQQIIDSLYAQPNLNELKEQKEQNNDTGLFKNIENSDWTSDEVHDHVMDLLMCEEDREDIFALFASDPKYYLDLFKNYVKTKEGFDIYLPYLFNITTKRTKGRLYISFKLYDNDKWVEVGYDIDTCKDEDVYKSFSEQVHYQIKHPQNKREKIKNISIHSSLADKVNVNNLVNLNNVSKAYKYMLDNYPNYIKKTNSDQLDVLPKIDSKEETNTQEKVQLPMSQMVKEPQVVQGPQMVQGPQVVQGPQTTQIKDFNKIFNEAYEKQQEVKEQKSEIKEVLVNTIKEKLNMSTFVSPFVYQLSKLDNFSDLLKSLNRSFTAQEYELLELVNKYGSEYEKHSVYNYLYNNNMKDLTTTEKELAKKFKINVNNL